LSRLRSDFWVAAHLRRCAVERVDAVLRRRGSAESGSIFVKVDRLDGSASLYGPAPQSVPTGLLSLSRQVVTPVVQPVTPSLHFAFGFVVHGSPALQPTQWAPGPRCREVVHVHGRTSLILGQPIHGPTLR